MMASTKITLTLWRCKLEILINKISETRQERLLNPQMSDHYRTWFQGKYGMKLYDIKVGRKWVFLRSKSHRAKLSLAKFKTQAFVQWHCDARTHASSETYAETGKYQKSRGWWKNYGFESNPADVNYDRGHLIWK